MAFHMEQVNYVDFLHPLIDHSAAVHSYVSPQLSWFVLSAMSSLSHVVFIRFHFKKQNELKKKLREKLIQKNEQKKYKENKKS